jgi:hypothetical protein
MAKIKNPGSVLNVEKVKIGGIDWNFEPLPLDSKNLGTCSTPDLHRIRINHHQWNKVDEDYIDTVLHECLHAMSAMKMGTKQLSEFHVSVIAEGLEEIFIENPKFVKWLSDYAAWVGQERKKKK